jgi:single-strand DNA-binding protein
VAGNINRVIITGNLTKDPELGSFGSGESGGTVCRLRVACNGRRRNSDTGNWEDQPNFFDVTVWGAQGENCAKYLRKGRSVAVDGRLRWREWTSPEGHKRQGVDIIAETVQFLGSGEGGGNGNGYANGNGFSSAVRSQESDVAIDTADFELASTGAPASDDDIPF